MDAYTVAAGYGQMNSYDGSPGPPPDGKVAWYTYGGSLVGYVEVASLVVRNVEFYEIANGANAERLLGETGMPTYAQILNGFDSISLASPTQLGSPNWHVKWQFKFSAVIGHALGTGSRHLESHAYTRTLFTDYDYIVTPSQDAAGWVDTGISYISETMSAGGQVALGGESLSEWNVEQLGGGLARIKSRSIRFSDAATVTEYSAAFAITTGWYNVELVAEAGTTTQQIRVWQVGSAVPAYHTFTAFPHTGSPATLYIFGTGMMFAPTPYYVGWDNIEIFAEVGDATPKLYGPIATGYTGKP